MLVLHCELFFTHARLHTQELRARLSGLRYLIIDEISMVSATTLLHVHRRLVEGTGNNGPYGGVSVIFIGDFFQLPPGEPCMCG